ncbi:hypothetical protein AVEN_263524-1 [Araneus ventricosus]|uniref:Uncharacterized protein n=1 Tax=Araneus ventricosus TaxID=182803 RepID=A0A4Y2TZT6_ARAVE|nr:hypothetical protein AVEN_263524-1 [Araneus ventricosus]
MKVAQNPKVKKLLLKKKMPNTKVKEITEDSARRRRNESTETTSFRNKEVAESDDFGCQWNARNESSAKPKRKESDDSSMRPKIKGSAGC